MVRAFVLNRFEIILPACIGIMLLFLLTEHPQNPDSAEMISVGLQGGVMHPTGFPFQAWINRLLILIPFGSPAERLSLFNVLCHCAGLFFFLKTVKLLRLPFASISLGAILLGLDLTLFSIALYPEKYSAIFFFIAAAIYLHHLYFYSNKKKLVFYTTSFLLGLALSHHTVLLILCPLWLNLFFDVTKCAGLKRLQKLRHVTFSVAFVAAPIVILYGSLLFLKSNAPWVDWGKLSSFKDVLNHLLRADFNYLELNPPGAEETHVPAIVYLWIYLKNEWTILTLFLPVGLWLFVRRNKFSGIYFLLSLLASLSVLTISKQDTTNAGIGYMERYIVIALPFLVLLFTIGISPIFQKIKHPVLSTAIAVVLLVLVCLTLPRKVDYFIKLDSNLIEIYRNIVKNELPSDAIYLTENDWEIFYGLPEKEGFRFPAFDMLAYPWYKERIFPQLAPRLYQLSKKLPRGVSWSFDDLLILAWEEGYVLASTDIGALKSLRNRAFRRGLVWVVDRNQSSKSPLDPSTEIKTICQQLERVRYEVTVRGNYFNKLLLFKIHDSLEYIADYHYKIRGQSRKSEILDLKTSIIPGVEPSIWKEKCHKLMSYSTSARTLQGT
ncbi:MAG: DUF2723 domain-containing protein [Deltaproteobacteria bacterium]|nr:DUF2723 domain-containing protein [Deltaproteobacteria bacterium]